MVLGSTLQAPPCFLVTAEAAVSDKRSGPLGSDQTESVQLSLIVSKKSTSDLMRISVKQRQLYLYAKEHEKKLQR
ncbi:hypothetical protein L6452_24648 [Arctium lappa]|uniref:Uncharacterized protein n=1 Tax=Arctium lappa TaxID=4217 RepID=A0ACB9AB05_ARCLA|nr:hypothetical protein L6452_24648 [Arctium lappa]